MGHNVGGNSARMVRFLNCRTNGLSCGSIERIYEKWGLKMQFERIAELANATPTAMLCEAWGACTEYVILCKASVRDMTIQEAGELAALHGMTLPDILSV